MKAKHTPGPWKLVTHGNHPSHENEQLAIVQTSKQYAFEIVAVESNDIKRDEFVATAALIALAPDMLDMLKEVIGLSDEIVKRDDDGELTETYYQVINSIQKLIDKATNI